MLYNCNKCEKSYKWRDSLTRHNRLEHSSNQVGIGKQTLLDNTSDTDDEDERYSPPEKLTRQNAIDYRDREKFDDDDRGEFKLTRQDSIPNPHFIESRNHCPSLRF